MLSSNSTKSMSDQYSFMANGSFKTENNILDNAVLVEDGVVWDNGEVQISFNYAAAGDETLTEGNEDHYLTATDEGNETHYFSVLENTDTNLSDLNEIAVSYEAENTEVDENTTESVCTIGGQPEIYRIEGSDDLYAFEVTCDEDGNVQRLRYKLRLNENGQYETVMESLEVVPFEDSLETLQSCVPTENETSLENTTVVVKEEEEQEATLPDLSQHSNTTDNQLQVDDIGEEREEEEEDSNNELLHIVEDTKSDGLDHSLLSCPKVEVFEETHSAIHQTFGNQEINEVPSSVTQTQDLNHYCAIPNHEYEEETEEYSSSSYNGMLIVENHNHGTIQRSRKGLTTADENSHDSMDSAHTEESIEHNISNAEYLEDQDESESENEDYQIVDGEHVTADTEEENGDVSHTLESIVQSQILKIQQQVPVAQTTIKAGKQKLNKPFTYYIIKHPEKENVATVVEHSFPKKIIKSNPRSVLKSSYSYFSERKEKDKPAAQKLERKGLKNKETPQTRVLNNFLAKTTIVHAPVRQQRLPRKQTIKPVERADEEIIVQEVVVSHNGFIEASLDDAIKSKSSLKSTEVVQVSDSDDDYKPKRQYKKKKKFKKHAFRLTEIIISDSEDSTLEGNDVIDLSADLEDTDDKSKKQMNETAAHTDVAIEPTRNLTEIVNTVNNEPIIKKRRGRPPKRRNSGDYSPSTTDTSSSSPKKQRSTKASPEPNKGSKDNSKNSQLEQESKVQGIKTKWKCSKCSKIFPSQGSLKSHMQYHTFHESNTKNSTNTNCQTINTFKKPDDSNIVKNKYQCTLCKDNFKNNVLLTRHLKEHESSSKYLECSICKKLFSDRAQLINHKRTHAKEQMIKTTTLTNHTPPKSGKKSPKQGLSRCDYCTKVFASVLLLNNHTQTHKLFVCSNCSSKFISKLALEQHVRLNCVKQLKPKSTLQQASFKTRKSFLALPSRISKRISTRNSIDKNNATADSKCILSSSHKEEKNTNLSLQCDSCPMKFSTHRALFSHKLIKHALDTPDKSMIMSSKQKKVHREPDTHNSVPAGERLRSAYAHIRTKLDV